MNFHSQFPALFPQERAAPPAVPAHEQGAAAIPGAPHAPGPGVEVQPGAGSEVQPGSDTIAMRPMENAATEDDSSLEAIMRLLLGEDSARVRPPAQPATHDPAPRQPATYADSILRPQPMLHNNNAGPSFTPATRSRRSISARHHAFREHVFANESSPPAEISARITHALNTRSKQAIVGEFVDARALDATLSAAQAANSHEIHTWLQSSLSANARVPLHLQHAHNIGTIHWRQLRTNMQTASAETAIRSLPTDHTTTWIRRDPAHPCGYSIVTHYPSLHPENELQLRERITRNDEDTRAFVALLRASAQRSTRRA